MIADLYHVHRDTVIFREVWAYYSKSLPTPDGYRRHFFTAIATNTVLLDVDPAVRSELERRGEVELDLSCFPPRAVTHLICKC